MLTFVRTGELRQAKWEDINFETKEWRLPAHTTKMKDEHIVPLSKQAIKLFQELKVLTGKGELAFPPQQRRRHMLMSENTINQLLKRMGYRGKLVGHGFRALASTTLNEMGYPADVIERQLAHAERNKVRAAYNRAEYLPHPIDTWIGLAGSRRIKIRTCIGTAPERNLAFNTIKYARNGFVIDAIPCQYPKTSTAVHRRTAYNAQ